MLDSTYFTKSTRDLRTFHNELATAALFKFGATKCPCCRNHMEMGRPRRRNAAEQNRRDRATVGHDIAQSMNGNPMVWVWICRGCNQDQGSSTFEMFANRLKHYKDERHGSVFELAQFVAEWCEQKGVDRKASVK